MGVDHSFSFTVVDQTRPNVIVAGSVPVPGFRNVPLTSQIKVTFDELMNTVRPSCAFACLRSAAETCCAFADRCRGSAYAHSLRLHRQHARLLQLDHRCYKSYPTAPQYDIHALREPA